MILTPKTSFQVCDPNSCGGLWGLLQRRRGEGRGANSQNSPLLPSISSNHTRPTTATNPTRSSTASIPTRSTISSTLWPSFYAIPIISASKGNGILFPPVTYQHHLLLLLLQVLLPLYNPQTALTLSSLEIWHFFLSKYVGYGSWSPFLHVSVCWAMSKGFGICNTDGTVAFCL